MGWGTMGRYIHRTDPCNVHRIVNKTLIKIVEALPLPDVIDTGHKGLMPGVTTTHPGILWARARHTMGVKGILWWVVVRAYYGSTL